MRARENVTNSPPIRAPGVVPRVVIVVLAVVAAVAVGCATAPPVELINARTAYDRACLGPAAQLAPADLRKARVALDQAERALSGERNLAKTIDFAYIAERTVQIAEAHAQTSITERKMATQAAGTVSAARSRGLLLLTCGLYGNVIRLLPPLTLSDEDAAVAMDILEAALRESAQ